MLTPDVGADSEVRAHHPGVGDEGVILGERGDHSSCRGGGAEQGTQGADGYSQGEQGHAGGGWVWLGVGTGVGTGNTRGEQGHAGGEWVWLGVGTGNIGCRWIP